MIGQNRGYTKKTIKESFCEYWISVILHDLQVFLPFFGGTPLIFNPKKGSQKQTSLNLARQEIYRRCQAPVPRPQRP